MNDPLRGVIIETTYVWVRKGLPKSALKALHPDSIFDPLRGQIIGGGRQWQE